MPDKLAFYLTVFLKDRGKYFEIQGHRTYSFLDMDISSMEWPVLAQPATPHYYQSNRRLNNLAEFIRKSSLKSTISYSSNLLENRH